jgi:hypothetical protein
MDAPSLLNLLIKVLDGLIDKGICVVSYACDGTEVERAVQRLFLDCAEKRQYFIKNPHPGCSPTIIKYAVYRRQVICMVQDSKHALKTMRNNLFSGARLLTFGNFVAIYRHIDHVAQGAKTPLFNRDVTKVDRQDDNAAVRLFSADVLKYLADHHPDYIGEIVYLFVFGELINAYQNRSMSHSERIKLALRTRYFLDSWETFLQSCGYRKDQYFISRESNDILRIIIEGLIALIIIHRDHLSGPVALLPWLHSSEACEHVFGEARQVVKDFTYLDFIYMIPKLRIKLHQAVLRGKSSNGKARAVGYSHTYFNHEGLDLVALSTFPTNAEIDSLAESAAQEANSLVALLGVNPNLLHRHQNIQPTIWLPGIQSWHDDGLDFLELDSEAEDSDEIGEAEELQRILDDEEASPISRSHRIDKKCLSLTSAALAIVTEEASLVFVLFFCHTIVSLNNTIFNSKTFAEVDEEELEVLRADEFAQVQQITKLYNTLPTLKIHDEPTRPLGLGSTQYIDLDFEMLINMRRQHQTKQAATGVRTKKFKPSSKNGTSMRGQIIREFHQALKEAQDKKAVGTGKLRDDRWKEGSSSRAPAPGGRGGIINGVTAPDLEGGNAVNAAVVAATVAKQVCKLQ